MPLVLETSKLIAPEPPAAFDEAPQNSAEVVTPASWRLPGGLKPPDRRSDRR